MGAIQYIAVIRILDFERNEEPPWAVEKRNITRERSLKIENTGKPVDRDRNARLNRNFTNVFVIVFEFIDARIDTTFTFVLNTYISSRFEPFSSYHVDGDVQKTILTRCNCAFEGTRNALYERAAS